MNGPAQEWHCKHLVISVPVSPDKPGAKPEIKHIMLRSILVAFIVSTSVISPAMSEEARAQRTLSLSGHGEVRTTPDIASISVGVITNSETATAALDANNKNMQAVLDALKAAGIAARDIQTSNLMVSQRYENRSDGSSQPQTAGFDASNNVNIVIRDLDVLGKILDQVVNAGANQVNGISFGIEKEEPKLDDARKLAVKEARRKAELYAAASGVVLGKVLTISENAAYQPQSGAVFKARAESADSVPIAQGEQVLAVDVNVTWEIK
jgi:uncharacterized protein